MKKCFAKNALLLSFFLFAAGYFNSVQAQKLVFLFGHVVYSSPTGGFKDGYKAGIGAEGGIGVGLLGKTFLTGTVGYSDFIHQNFVGSNPSDLHYTPIKLGIRHYLFAKILFIHGDLGIGKISVKNPEYSASKFSGDFGAGVKLAAFEVLADYDGFAGTPTGSWIGIKAGFSFGL